MSKIYEYTVIDSKLTSPSTLVVTLYDNERRKPLTFEPGQYAAVSFLNKRNRPTPARCFSISSSPTEQGFLQFGIRVGGGFTKTAQRELAPGSKMIVEGPFGSFTFNATRDRSAMFLAGGIGVTPFLSMIRYATRLQMPNDIMLVYSCRTQDDIPFLKELIELRQMNPHFGLLFVIGSGPVDKLVGQYVTMGRIDGKLLDNLVSQVYMHRTYFICGPPGFMQGVSATLVGNGAAPETVITEAFSQGQRGPRTLAHNIPLQVYTMTGLSLVLGTAVITVNDAVKAVPSASTADTAQNTNADTSTNSQQQAIDQTIASLESGNTTPASTDTAQTTSTNTAPTSSSAPATSTPATVSPTPTPSPSPSPTPAPAPTPTPTPTPTPAPTPTPTPTPAPTPVAPVLSFSASSTKISSGSSTTLMWSVNADATTPVTCTASGGWSGTKATSGSQTEKPGSSTTYNLSCSNSAGKSSKSVSVCVSTASQSC